MKAMTPTQEQVLRKIAVGQPIKAIGDDLGLSPKTIEYHWGKLKVILGINGPAEAAHYAIARKLVPLRFVLALVLPLLAAMSARASMVNLAWDASPDVGVTNYVIYMGTNTLTATNLATAIKFSAGTNLTARITFSTYGTTSFTCAAQANGAESDICNVITLTVARPPANLRTFTSATIIAPAP